MLFRSREDEKSRTIREGIVRPVVHDFGGQSDTLDA